MHSFLHPGLANGSSTIPRTALSKQEVPDSRLQCSGSALLAANADSVFDLGVPLLPAVPANFSDRHTAVRSDTRISNWSRVSLSASSLFFFAELTQLATKAQATNARK